jgi:hypothetical protein
VRHARHVQSITERGRTGRNGPSASNNPGVESLLGLQRTAGNAAVSRLVVQRASATEIAAAKATADGDFAAGRIAPYFAGNFLANHIEAASQGAMALADKSGGSKAARSQAYKKLEQRASVDAGGSGWGSAKKMTGTNTLILDFGIQKKLLMRAVNVGALDVAGDATHPYIHPKTEERLRSVTYSSSGKREEKTGVAELGAKFDAGSQRYAIDHLGGIT